ncbi:MAG: DUF1697 domain-containing protein [Actinobacteria bacterium]|nr:DUF1697 domain-containing protein [Actinomycetota bacterium]
MTTRCAVLLRGVNVGKGNRIAMSDFTAVLATTGATDVRTLLNSGNAVCTSRRSAASLESAVAKALVKELGLDVPVVTRTSEEIDAVIALNPLAEVADEPSRYLVVFLDRAPDAEAIESLLAVDAGDEVWQVHGRELYLWLPAGIAESAVNKQLMRGVLGVTWTARNWSTVLKLQAAL